jgi:hypothetical protein
MHGYREQIGAAFARPTLLGDGAYFQYSLVSDQCGRIYHGRPIRAEGVVLGLDGDALH